MRKFLYDDFYEGLLHMIIIFIPLFLFFYDTFSTNNIGTVLITLIVSIGSEMYDARNVYKDKSYYANNRIKIEMIYILIIFSISLVYAIVILYMLTRGDCTIVLKDIYIPIWLYFFGFMAYFVEWVYGTFVKDFNLTPLSKKTEAFPFNVTDAQIN